MYVAICGMSVILHCSILPNPEIYFSQIQIPRAGRSAEPGYRTGSNTPATVP